MQGKKTFLVAFVLVTIYLDSVIGAGLSPEEKKECFKMSKRYLKSMMKSFNACNDKLQLQKEDFAKKIGCVVKCVMQSVGVLNDQDIMTEETLKGAIEAQIPPGYVAFAHGTLVKCIGENPLDPKDETCKSYMALGTCMQGAVSEICGGEMPML